MGCIIALDVGTRTIGIARAHSVNGIATPHSTLSRKGVKKDTAKLIHLMRELQVETVVVGLPYELDDTEGRSARLARQVGDALGAALTLEIHYYDERFSSVSAEEKLKELGKSYNRRRKEIDQAAAAVILSQWFESLIF